MIRFFFKLSPECYCWILALTYLAIIHPAEEHFSLCFFHLMGFTWCPGCGIGHSISYIFHGNFNAAWNAHPMGFVAIPVLGYRIIQLIGGALTAVKSHLLMNTTSRLS
ncbi:hypothetical protein BH11BAC2_BH11BAC2_05160 [soil metagenome]